MRRRERPASQLQPFAERVCEDCGVRHCYWCGGAVRNTSEKAPDQATREHLRPRAWKRGTVKPRSPVQKARPRLIVVACRACNETRGSERDGLPWVAFHDPRWNDPGIVPRPQRERVWLAAPTRVECRVAPGV